MNPTGRPPRGHFSSVRRNGPGDLAIAGLSELIGAELERALVSEPQLLAELDPGRVLLLWYAVGATAAVCQMTDRTSDAESDAIFRTVVARIFDGRGARADLDPTRADHRLIELFESAGAEAVAARMRGETKLGYYVEALRVGRGLAPA